MRDRSSTEYNFACGMSLLHGMELLTAHGSRALLSFLTALVSRGPNGVVNVGGACSGDKLGGLYGDDGGKGFKSYNGDNSNNNDENDNYSNNSYEDGTGVYINGVLVEKDELMQGNKNKAQSGFNSRLKAELVPNGAFNELMTFLRSRFPDTMCVLSVVIVFVCGSSSSSINNNNYIC